MDRLIALDTETTGKMKDGSPGDHRIIEIGCVEIVNRKITGKKLHLYLNPERAVDEEAQWVHGLSNEFLADKPRFAEVADQIRDFIKDSVLIIHNAKFDTGFLDHEWQLMGLAETTAGMTKNIIDTVRMAVDLHYQATLDNLAVQLKIDKDFIEKRSTDGHGALLDAEILAEVYLAMTFDPGSLEFEQGQDWFTGKTWERKTGYRLPRFNLPEESLAVHKVEVLQTVLGQKLPDVEAGKPVRLSSSFGPEFEFEVMPLQKGEDKKAYKKRQQEQFETFKQQLLSEHEQELYATYTQKLQELYDAWEARILGKVN